MGMPELKDVRSKKFKAPTDEQIEQFMEVEGKHIVVSCDGEMDEAQASQESSGTLGIEGDLPLSPDKPKKEPTKWIVAPTSKGQLKGYYVSPKTPFQRKTSQERRDLLKQKMVDVISQDTEAWRLASTI
jgi:hypothetical protein